MEGQKWDGPRLSGVAASPLGGTALPGSMFRASLQKQPLSQRNPNQEALAEGPPTPGPASFPTCTFPGLGLHSTVHL